MRSSLVVVCRRVRSRRRFVQSGVVSRARRRWAMEPAARAVTPMPRSTPPSTRRSISVRPDAGQRLSVHRRRDVHQRHLRRRRLAARPNVPTSVIRARSKAAWASARSPTSAPIRATIAPTTASPAAGATASATARAPAAIIRSARSASSRAAPARRAPTRLAAPATASAGPTSGQPCDPYQCNPSGDDCLTICTTNDDCIAGSFCNNGSCGRKPLGATCTVGDECNSLICAQGVCCNQRLHGDVPVVRGRRRGRHLHAGSRG